MINWDITILIGNYRFNYVRLTADNFVKGYWGQTL